MEEGNGLWDNIKNYPETLNVEVTSDDYAADSEAQADAEAEGMYMLVDEVKDKVANILMDAFHFFDPDSLGYITFFIETTKDSYGLYQPFV